MAFLAVSVQAQDFTKPYSNDTQFKADVLAAFTANVKAQVPSFTFTLTGVSNAQLQAESNMIGAYAQDPAGLVYDFEGQPGIDYASLCLKGLGLSTSGSGTTLTITITPQYWETADQTAAVDAYVASKLPGIVTAGMTDYQKLKAIHDYIANNFSYDASLNNHSAYSMIQPGNKGVCQAYTMLFYRFALAAGFNANRQGIILRGASPGSTATGTTSSGTENHTWNIVQLSGKWYHMDVTWDDPTGGSVRYTYFLKGNTTMAKDHNWDKTLYSFVSDSDYVPSAADTAAPSGINTNPTASNTTASTGGTGTNPGTRPGTQPSGTNGTGSTEVTDANGTPISSDSGATNPSDTDAQGNVITGDTSANGSQISTATETDANGNVIDVTTPGDGQDGAHNSILILMLAVAGGVVVLGGGTALAVLLWKKNKQMGG